MVRESFSFVHSKTCVSCKSDIYLNTIVTLLFVRESGLHSKCSDQAQTQCVEKMDNKTIQKLRELYFKVSAFNLL